VKIEKVISGGQTGVDRAALDWAIRNGIPHGGWCTKGRRAEDGYIPDRYVLQETPQRHYRQRTKRNVREADATLIVTLSAELSGGSLFTREYANKLGKPCAHVYPMEGWQRLMKPLKDLRVITVLNVAGARASKAPGIEQFVDEVLSELARSSGPATNSPQREVR
jgi:hypothetical protein